MKLSRMQLLALVALLCWLGALCLVPLRTPLANTQVSTITVQVDKPGAAIAPTMFGLFFEDSDFGADGGLYPERVKNRSFEFPDPMLGWKRLARGEAKGALQIFDVGSRTNQPNAHYLQTRVDSGNGFGLTNEGFRGAETGLLALSRRRHCRGAASGNALSLDNQWETTIGAVPDRKLIVNRWNTEFRHRPTPDYYQSFGLG